MRRARSLKFGVIGAFVIAAGLGLTASTQDWFGFTLIASTRQSADVMVQGSDAAAGLTALSLAGIALAGALAMAGRIARLLLGILGVVLGVCILWSSAAPLGDPIASGASAISKQTGIAGDTAVHHLVASTEVMVWPVVGIVSGALFTLAGLVVIITFMAWPATSRRYEAVRFADASGKPTDASASASDPTGASDGAPVSEAQADEQPDPEQRDSDWAHDLPLPDQQGSHARDAAIDSWDELSRGDDPTA